MSSGSTGRIFTPHAAVLAWLFPGLGHIILGHRRRGILIMIGMLSMFGSGLLIGGLDVVDSKNDTLWYYAQVGNGPIAIGADMARGALVPEVNRDWGPGQPIREQYRSGDADTLAALHRPSLSHVNEIGTLYIALGGLLNLAVILDALYSRPRTASSEPRSRRAEDPA